MRALKVLGLLVLVIIILFLVSGLLATPNEVCYKAQIKQVEGKGVPVIINTVVQCASIESNEQAVQRINSLPSPGERL